MLPFDKLFNVTFPYCNTKVKGKISQLLTELATMPTTGPSNDSCYCSYFIIFYT